MSRPALIIEFKEAPKAIGNVAISLLIALEHVGGSFRRDYLTHRYEGTRPRLESFKSVIETRAWNDPAQMERWQADAEAAPVLADFIERHGVDALNRLADKIEEIIVIA